MDRGLEPAWKATWLRGLEQTLHLDSMPWSGGQSQAAQIHVSAPAFSSMNPGRGLSAEPLLRLQPSEVIGMGQSCASPRAVPTLRASSLCYYLAFTLILCISIWRAAAHFLLCWTGPLEVLSFPKWPAMHLRATAHSVQHCQHTHPWHLLSFLQNHHIM